MEVWPRVGNGGDVARTSTPARRKCAPRRVGLLPGGKLNPMAVQTLITPEEYLQTAFDGADCEFVDGAIVERNWGENPHSKAQVRLVEIFYEARKQHPLYSRPELRMQLAPTLFRIPDVAVFRLREPVDLVPSEPPFIVIEIVSPEDRHTDIVEKLEEYRTWGVPHIWPADPWPRQLSVYEEKGLVAVGAFRLPDFDLEIKPADLFE